jgi:hypothetical protein
MRRSWLLCLAVFSLWFMSSPLAAVEFGGWMPLDSGATPSAPALVYDAADNLHLFVRGTDQVIYHRTRDSAGVWGAWEALGGLTPSAPSATFDALTGTLHVFVRGTDNGIYQNTREATGTWSGWTPVGGLTTESIGAATDSTGNTTLAVKDVDGTGLWITEGGPGGGAAIPRDGWTIHFVDSELDNAPATHAIDGDPATFWRTVAEAPLPHELQINLGAVHDVSGFRYLPRQDSSNGRILGYEFYVSPDGVNWGTPVNQGTFATDTSEQAVQFAAQPGQYVRLRVLSVQQGMTAAVAELNVLE